MRRSLQAASTDYENMDGNRSMKTATKRRMTLQEKRRQIFMASSTKIPLRPVRPTHPRNIMSFVPKKGHYASVPWTNIGGQATGVRGEYKYAINGPPSPRPIVHPPRSGPCPFSPPCNSLFIKEGGLSCFAGSFVLLSCAAVCAVGLLWVGLVGAAAD
jgi:hypothetical protein